MSAGKGDRPRPVDQKKYAANYDRIFRKRKLPFECSREKCCNEQACKELEMCIQKIA
jgi:hypothetical protein